MKVRECAAPDVGLSCRLLQPCFIPPYSYDKNDPFITLTNAMNILWACSIPYM